MATALPVGLLISFTRLVPSISILLPKVHGSCVSTIQEEAAEIITHDHNVQQEQRHTLHSEDDLREQLGMLQHTQHLNAHER